jgi:hypothetical protein
VEVVGLLLILVGVVVGSVGGIWLLVKGFQESAMWGLGMLFIPLVSLFFVITHWEDAKKPFLYNIGGVVLIFIGAIVGGMGKA